MVESETVFSETTGRMHRRSESSASDVAACCFAFER